MISTGTNTQLLSTLISSTPGNTIRRTEETIVAEAIPPPLAAPAGWRSEIVYSNSPIPTDTEVNLVRTNNTFQNNYLVHNTTNTFNTSQTDQLASRFINNNNEYINTSIDENPIHQRHSAFTERQQQNRINTNEYQQQSVLTEQQQQRIINTVVHQQPPPVIVRKTLPNNVVTYQQNVSVRYLKPPTPPPPGPLIIREVRPPPPPPQSPIQIRQRAPPVPTPPPLILRERPPPIPPRSSEKVVEKLLPPLPRLPRRVVVERYGACPPKPSDVVIERWLPYKQSGRQRILLERAEAHSIPPQEPNLLILHDSPHARVCKEFINEGVVRADPDSYMQRYGAELNSWHTQPQHAYLVGEATRAIPPPITSSDHRYRHDYDGYCSDGYQRASSPYISSGTWDRARVSSPIHRSSSYNYSSSPYNFSSDYCAQSSTKYGYDSHRSYDDYSTRKESYLTMTDVTPSWNRYCRSSSHDDYSSSHYPLPSSNPHQTIRVNSDNEFRRVLCDLTNGHVPAPLQSY